MSLFANITNVFKIDNGLPVTVKKGTRITDADSDIVYEFDGKRWVAIAGFTDTPNSKKPTSYTPKVSPGESTQYIPSSSDISRQNDDVLRQMLAAYILADNSSNSSSSYSSCSSSSYSSNDSSSYSSSSSDSGSSYDSSSSSGGCD